MKLLGITVLPEYIQSEGVEGLLDNMTRIGVNAVATSPYLMEEADPSTGQREPPADAGAGAVRLLDRPLFGKREVWVKTAPSFKPDKSLYHGLRYQPSEPTALTDSQGHILHDFIKAAQARHIKVYFQVQAAIPPGYRVQFGGPVDEDRALLPDGRIPPKRLAKNGSLASPEILGYEHALIRDLVKNYPDLDGLRFDWPEYAPYFLDSIFLDFSLHAHKAADRMGFDFERMRRDVGDLYKKLHGALTDDDLRAWVEDDDQGRYHLLRLTSDSPGVGDWLRFKARLVEEMLSGFRQTMDAAGGERMEMLPNAFPPPWTIASGMDFRRVGRLSTAISCKLYTMHWPMMLRFYGDQIREANPGLDDRLLTKFLVRWLDLADDGGFDSLNEYAYPGPDTPHPVGEQAQKRKIRQAQADAGDTPVYVLAHGYGPTEDFRKRLEIARDVGEHGYWVNRYAYLHDEKLEVIRQVGV